MSHRSSGSASAPGVPVSLKRNFACPLRIHHQAILATVLWAWAAYFVTTVTQQTKLLLHQQDLSVRFIFLEQSKTPRKHQSLPTTQNEEHLETLYLNATNMQQTSNRVDSSCSHSWLTGPRLGNVRDTNLTRVFELLAPLSTLPPSQELETRAGPSTRGPPLQRQSPLDATYLVKLTEETICFNTSRWILDTTDERLWTARLVYWAIYWHQHYPVLQDITYSARQHCPTTEQRDLFGIGPFDYECTNARFLVVSMSEKGIGANFRLTAVSVLKAALATNRIALFVNNVGSAKPLFLREPWAAASCTRRDSQCFFRPLTPCVLLEHEVADAYVLQRAESRQLFRHGILPTDHAHDRVIAFNTASRPQRNPSNLQSILFNISLQLVQSHPALQTIAVRQGLNRFLQPLLNSSNVFQGDNEISNGLMMYALRPLPPLSKRLRDIVDRTTSAQDLEPFSAIGLPLRGKMTVDSIFHVS